MVNLRLKNTILEIVNNQIKENNPPCTREVYQKLLDADYSKSEARDKIGAVVLTEIYDILKEGKNFDEEKYKEALEDMLCQCLDYEADYHVETEWDEWGKFMQEGYENFDKQEVQKGLEAWKKAFAKLQIIMEHHLEFISVFGMVEELEYAYPLNEWLQDYEMELRNARKYKDCILFCQKTLEMFDWEEEDDSCYRCGIGDSLFYLGQKEEACKYYEEWLSQDPQNENGISGYSWILLEKGDEQKAYDIVRKATWGVQCYADNSFLFMRAKQLAELVGKEQESEWYQQQLDKWRKSLAEWEAFEDDIFDEFTAPKKVPVVKVKKIYPNDPCPCGSGKKYKKCCARS